jgi:geranylgeranyl diphosphate synthase type II
MRSFPELHEIIEKELADLYYPSTPKNLYDPIKYVLNIGGKRIRPILMLLSHQLFSEDIEKSLKAALGIEVFHNFTLLHDDIMDKAPLRRGLKTVHEKWDNNTAILSGDTMLVQAFHLISQVENKNLRKVLEIFNKASTEVCEGQQWDMDFEEREDVTLSEYLKMIEYKTSVLLATSLQIGGINAGASAEQQDHLYEFGKNIGIAFQLKDDLLDAFGNPETFGKQVGGDIIANKKTFLYLKALQLANESKRKQLIQLFSVLENKNKVDEVKSIFSDINIQKHTVDLIKAYYTKAMKHLDTINSDKKEPLFNFAEKIKERIT